MKNRNKIHITDFTFEFAGYGHYKVTYKSNSRSRHWIKLITDMTIIDKTKNAEDPKTVHLNTLKKIVKS